MMDVRFLLASFAAVLCFTVVITSNTTETSTDAEKYDMFTCVAKSGDQKLCDDFIKCLYQLPKPIDEAAKNCTAKIPDGKTCTKEKELFNSEKDRKQLLECIADEIPKDFTPEQVKQFEIAQ
ncbi:hypothetical protein NPIL_269861, partial [Nephila pilipes]